MDLTSMLAKIARDSREQRVRTMTATVLPGGNLRYDTDIDSAAPVAPTDSLAGTPAVGSRVLCLIDKQRVIILGPIQLPEPPRVDSGVFTEPFDGPQTSWVPFSPGAFQGGPTAPPITVTVTLMSGAGAHTWDAPRVIATGPTGFQLFTRNGAGAKFAWIAHQKAT